MYIIFEFEKNGSTINRNKILSVKITDNIALKPTINDTGNVHKAYMRIISSETTVINAALNNPASLSVTLNETDTEKVDNVTVIGASGPYARKITPDPVINIRPAAYRAGSTSIFKNL